MNLKADNQAFREARFNVVSHNGVVLLVGQIQNQSLKQKATEIISKASSKINAYIMSWKYLKKEESFLAAMILDSYQSSNTNTSK